LETPFDRLSPITSNLTLYAAYSEGWHTVSFVTAGTAVDPILVQNGEVLNVPTSTLEGYVFIGWYIDPLRKNLYQNTPILFDMTLYAKFEEIVKYTLTYHFGDETTSLLLEEGTVPTLTDVFLEGYVFDGWFLDPDGLLPYTPTAISEDIDLYAKLTRIEFEVTTMVSGTSSVQIVGYGDEPMLMDPTLDGYVFVGWYLDSQWNTRYELAPTYENLTLYAKFSQSAYMVSFYLDSELLEETMFGIDETILYPEVTLPGLVVSGWYLDQALTIPWIESNLTSDISLYAKMEAETYTIRFLRDDGSVLSQMIALYGTPLVYPSYVQKPDTISYTYTFVGWNEEDTSVTTSKDYIAMFEQNFRIESVHLNPGVSTLYQGEPYEEAGAFSDDPLIDIVWDDTLDTTETGKYEIVYHFMDGDIEVFTLSRMIRVLERPVEIIIHLNPGIDTFEEGDSYTDPGAETNVGEIMVIGQVDVFTPGIYQIIYTVEYEGQIISKSRYVCVVGSIIWVSSPIWKEETYDA
ncbi:MAG: InlB B-repeat-containing protein, partial [Candidatus Izemoplasmatales bacterium]|nr:InlB B-repeat-containing protein [Candidatus Izemoplasmatales bacterium]